MPRELFLLKATAVLPAKRSRRGRLHPAGVRPWPRRKRTAQETWEAHVSPRERNGNTGSRTRISDAGKLVCGRTSCRPKGKRTSVPRRGRRAARGEPELFAEGNEGVGGPRRSVGRRGTGVAPGPGRAKAARVDVKLQEGTMTDASTSENLVTELMKVVERAQTGTRRTVSLAGAI